MILDVSGNIEVCAVVTVENKTEVKPPTQLSQGIPAINDAKNPPVDNAVNTICVILIRVYLAFSLFTIIQ